jgi:glycosyltransferase involved in cell wall biosynthesis
MTAAVHPIRVLELRSVLGTGGGPEKTILLGTAQTDRSRYAITVCYLRDERDADFRVDRRATSLPIDYVEIRERRSLDPRIWPQLKEIVRSRKIDIVHAHDYKTDALAYLLGRTLPVIPMATAHGWSGHSAKERYVYYPADRRILARLPAVITVSGDIRQALLDSGARPERVQVVPNGIDHLRFTRDRSRERAARDSFAIRPDDVVIGAVGRLESEKNYAMLLNAFSEILPAHPRLLLVIAGDGSLRPQLLSLARELGLGYRCRFLGHVDQVIDLHHTLDAYVMCSDNEGSPNAVLEAMALETPVVCTNVGGVSDLVRDGVDAQLVPRRDQRALTTALARVVSDRVGARARATAARRKVEEQLSFERRMKTVERLYDQLLVTYPHVRQGVSWWKSPHA